MQVAARAVGRLTIRRSGRLFTTGLTVGGSIAVVGATAAVGTVAVGATNPICHCESMGELDSAKTITTATGLQYIDHCVGNGPIVVPVADLCTTPCARH